MKRVKLLMGIWYLRFDALQFLRANEAFRRKLEMDCKGNPLIKARLV